MMMIRHLTVADYVIVAWRKNKKLSNDDDTDGDDGNDKNDDDDDDDGHLDTKRQYTRSRRPRSSTLYPLQRLEGNT